MSNNTQKKMKQEDNKHGLMSKFRKSLRKKKETKDAYDEKSVSIVQESQSVVKEKADSDYAKSIDSNGNNRNSIYSLNRNSVAPDIEKLFDELEKVKNEADKVKEDLENRNQTLTNELEASRQIIEKFQKGASVQPDNTEVDQLKIELQQKDVIAQELNSQLATIKDEFEKFKKESSEVEPEELNKKTVLVDNKQEIINLKSELEQRNSTIQQLTSELAATKKDDEKVPVKQEKNNDAQTKIEQLQLALNESKAENAKLLTEIDQKDNHIDQLTSDLTASQKESMLTKKIDQSEYENLQNSIKSISNENIAFKAIIEETRNSLDSSVEENAHLTTSLEKSQSLLKLKTKELNNLTNLMENSKRSLSKNSDEIADLKDDVKKGEKIINELRAELKASKVEAETAKKAVTEQQQHFDQSTKIKLEKIVAEKEEMKKENEMIAAELQNAKSEIHTKKSEFESARKVLRHELEETNFALQELKDQLESRNQTIQNQLEMIKLTVPKDRHDSVQSELESTKAELNSIKNKHVSVSTSDELREELSCTKAELKATRDASEWEKSRNERTISELRHQIETLSTSLSSLRVKEKEFEKYNALEQQYTKLQQQNESTVMYLQQQNESMKMQLQQQQNEAKTQAQKLKKDNERLRNENSKLESQKAREQAEKAQKSHKSKSSKTSKIIPIESGPIETVIDRNIDQTTSPKLQPTSTSYSDNGVVEPTQTTRSVEVIPQANIMTPEDQQNVAIPRPKKEEGDGWITVQKRRNVKQRNSMTVTKNQSSVISGRSLFLIKTIFFTLLFISLYYFFDKSGGLYRFNILLDYYKTYHIF
ncbi:hypothetical protein Glove_283g15 [Diversispora epigaea]|uniref:Uncharacterized protein n=1 Tax=Diversispora epigaea TaxID=1348612 RepID=A0A397I2W3_9GLOM|nr:hypothetical protein Glove_283g15 [Diversispora epigaea]